MKKIPTTGNVPILLEELRRQTTLLEAILKIVKNQNGTDKEEYLTVAQAAKILKRSPTSIRRWIAANKIEGIKINNSSSRDRYLIPRNSLQMFIQKARV